MSRYTKRRRDDRDRGHGPIEEPIEDLVEDMTEHLRRARREQGPERANREWMEGPLDEWLDHLDDGDDDLDDEVMAALAVGMNETLAIRDALILSLVSRCGECDRDVMMDILSRPAAPEVALTVRDLMYDSFGDAWHPDMERCRTGIAMFDRMAMLVPHRLAAQPLASIAYILWWVEDPRAPMYAMRSLEADGECSLATLILYAADRDARPCDERGRMRG